MDNKPIKSESIEVNQGEIQDEIDDETRRKIRKEIRKKIEHQEAEKLFFSDNLSTKEYENIDVLMRMRPKFNEGPLQVLCHCVIEKTYVKVYTRNHTQVRGIMTGLLEAFDKHWNLVLSDVEELYTQAKYGREPYVKPITDHDRRVPAQLGQGFVTLSEQTVPPKNKKIKSFLRKLPRVFIRGDNVVLVIPLKEKSSPSKTFALEH